MAWDDLRPGPNPRGVRRRSRRRPALQKNHIGREIDDGALGRDAGVGYLGHSHGRAAVSSSLAFAFTPHAFTFSTGFVLGLGSTTLYAMYCYLGYFGVCYLGDEVVNPTRTIPRAIGISVITGAVINLLFCLSIMGVVPWRELLHSNFMVCEFMQRSYGHWAGWRSAF